MRFATALALLFCSATLSAQTMIPIPPYSSTFSVSTATRGLYFQAPIDFSILGLRVPDERSHGLQNVEVYLMAAEPPRYSGSATGGVVFYSVGQPSSQIIPVNIPVRTGQWVGVLGGCGDASVMNNSYGSTSPFASNVLGAPMQLWRFLTQTNLASSGGNQPYSSEIGPIGRVEVYVGSSCNGSVSLLGTGCNDSGGTPNSMNYSGCPDLGTTLTVEMNTSTTATGPLFLILGLSDQNWSGIVLPLDLTPFGAPGCWNYVSHEAVLGGFTPAAGQATLNLPIPTTPYLVGAASFLQTYHLDIGLNPLNLGTSNYLAITIG